MKWKRNPRTGQYTAAGTLNHYTIIRDETNWVCYVDGHKVGGWNSYMTLERAKLHCERMEARDNVVR